MGNSRNLANLLGTGSTIASAKIADDAITSAKIADDAVTVAKLSNTAPLGRRRMTINGAMNVAERGTSFTGKTTSHYCVDRYQVEITTAGTWSTSQSTTSPDGFAKSLKLDCTTADSSLGSGDLMRIVYKFEGQDMQHLLYGDSGAKEMVLSFWVRSNKTGTYNLQFQQADNSYKQVVKSFVINTADTWEQKEVTIPGDTSGVINDDNGEGFRICWVLAAGSTFTGGSERLTWTTFANADVAPTQTVNLADSTSNEFYLTGVQLEIGSSKTEFEYRKYSEEQQQCKRYFQSVSDHYYNANRHNDSHWDGHIPAGHHEFHPEMRAAPTTSGLDVDGWLDGESGWRSESTTAASPTGMTSKKVNFTGVFNWHGNYNDTHGWRFYADYDAEL